MFAGLNVHSGNLFFTSNFQNTNPALHSFIFVPQAWTLGLELMFYVIAPFLLRKRLRIIVLLILLSLLLRVIIYNYFGLQHDPWTYRFFPTEIAFFLCGNLSYRIFKRIEKQNIKRLYAIVIFSGLILFTTLYSNLPSLNIVISPFQ
jgi:peptidoglycan/LPS O-acetylase OafA/YrhL